MLSFQTSVGEQKGIICANTIDLKRASLGLSQLF